MISVRSCTRLIVGTCSLGARYQKSRVLPTTSKQEIGCFWQVKMISPHFHHGPMASLGLQHSNSGIRQPSHGQGLRHWICPESFHRHACQNATLPLSKQFHSSKGLPCSIPNCLPKPFATLAKAARISDGIVSKSVDDCRYAHNSNEFLIMFSQCCIKQPALVHCAVNLVNISSGNLT